MIVSRVKCFLILLLFLGANLASAQQFNFTYQNPIINKSLPDPTVIKAKDGYFYFSFFRTILLIYF